jgi:DNA helicase-2/ATP-dependent DNA helicase PcrA
MGLAENFTIYDTSDSRQVLRRTLERLDVDATQFTPERLASAISWAKNSLMTAERYEPRPGSPMGQVTARVYPAYQARLLASNAVDFDDLLLHVATLLRDNPEIRSALDQRYQHVLVDEYQDTNLAQYTIARALSIDAPNLAVTGDPDQSIYGWRGANLNNILDFETDYPHVRVVKLERNYRSTQRILRVADTLIQYNRRRKAKRLFTENAEGQSVRLLTYGTQQTEAESIAAQIAAQVRAGRRRPRDYAIFYRVNALSRGLEFALRDEGVPYQVVSGLEFFERREIKDTMAYLRLINNPRDDNALLRVINTPPRGIGKTTIQKLADHAARRNLSLLDAARESGLIDTLNKKSAVDVARFVALFDRLTLVAGAPVEEILGHVLSESGYRDFLRDSDEEDDQERLANIEELLTAARQFDERHPGDGALEAFLEESCLVNETDAWEAADDRVTLMTLHASKGLEFPVVYNVALEEGLLPHERSQQNEESLEEERRLLFVGMTRAREELSLTRATYREFRGQRRLTVPSNFLMELPRGEMELNEPGSTPPTFVEEHYEQYQEDWQADARDEFDPRLFEASGPEADTSTSPSLAALPVQTAAELARSTARALPAVSPDAFHQGMIVTHPSYGLGKVIALSGNGERRTATIAFASGAGQKKFVLARSPLRPTKSGS